MRETRAQIMDRLVDRVEQEGSVDVRALTSREASAVFRLVSDQKIMLDGNILYPLDNYSPTE